MGDSIYRWIKYKKRNEDPRGAIRKAHGYLFIHYFSIAIAFSFWALSTGELDPAHNPHILNKLAGFLLIASGWYLLVNGPETTICRLPDQQYRNKLCIAAQTAS